MTDSPRILLWDLETSHNIQAAFTLFEDYTVPENILQERFIICGSWRWLGEKKTHSVSVLDDPKLFKKDPCNDLHVLKVLHGVLSEADVIVAHNGDKFDIRYAEARMLIQGLDPLPPITKIDTLKVAKKRLLFNANRLDYLGKVLGVGRKMKTTNGLWLKVLQGDRSAIKKMVEYNKGDVELLERVFLKLRPFCANHISRELFGKAGCPRCGSTKVQARGVYRTSTKSYQRLRCSSCTGWFRRLKAEPGGTSVRNI